MMHWRKETPTIEDLNGQTEAYFWVRGGLFNRPIIAKANHGARRVKAQDDPEYRGELNFQFHTENAPVYIWASALHQWPMLAGIEWAGPIPKPGNKVIPDYPELDFTDGAHPAWWRGYDAATADFCRHTLKILDGNDTGAGANNEPWASVRRRLLHLTKGVRIVKPHEQRELVNRIRDRVTDRYATHVPQSLREMIAHVVSDELEYLDKVVTIQGQITGLKQAAKLCKEQAETGETLPLLQAAVVIEGVAGLLDRLLAEQGVKENSDGRNET